MQCLGRLACHKPHWCKPQPTPPACIIPPCMLIIPPSLVAGPLRPAQARPGPLKPAQGIKHSAHLRAPRCVSSKRERATRHPSLHSLCPFYTRGVLSPALVSPVYLCWLLTRSSGAPTSRGLGKSQSSAKGLGWQGEATGLIRERTGATQRGRVLTSSAGL
jgi:hypothetical protein